MEKRTFLAILLSLAILMAWSALVSKPHHIANKEVVEQGPVASQRWAPAQNTTQGISPQETQGISPQDTGELLLQEIGATEVIGINGTEIYYGSKSGQIEKVLFKALNHTLYLNQGFTLSGFDFNDIKVDDGMLLASAEDGQKRITLRFIFRNTNVINRLDIEVENLTSQTISPPLKFILVRNDLTQRGLDSRFNQTVVGLAEGILRPNFKKAFESSEFVDFIAFRDRYFCIILEPHSGVFNAFIEKADNKQSFFGLRSSNIVVPPQSKRVFRFDFYLGPQRIEQIGHLNKRWAEIINFGFFDPISKFLFGIIRAFRSITKNWGFAIILFSITIFIFLSPLTLKQMRSMKEMQAIQPHVEKLRKMHKDSPQKLNKEIMELYREHKVNPLGGCLPLVLQIPVFFSLYQALMRSVELKGANFLWVKDLSAPDKLFTLSQRLPVIGQEINILPILMLLVMFWQQRTSLKSASGANAEQQKMMSFIFPLLFGFIFYRMPSGLVLYWLFNSSLMAFTQFRMLRHAK